jgi:hypothetical protein
MDEDHKVRYVNGNAGAFLNLPAGEASYSVMHLLAPEMSLELGALLHRAIKLNQQRAVSMRASGKTGPNGCRCRSPRCSPDRNAAT